MFKKYYYILLFLTITNTSFAQIEFVQNNEVIVSKNGEDLINPWAGGMNFCQFSKIDLNLDGKDDLFIFDRSGKNGTVNGNRIIPFLFDTVINKFKYAPNYVNAFPALTDWALLVDYNQDMKADIFTSYESSIALYTNNSNNELSFEFTKILTSDAGFGQIPLYVSSSDIPAIIDVDGDLDIDILTFDPSGTHIYFHENKSIQMYGITDSINLIRSDNCWGRFKEDFSTNSVTMGLDEDCNENEDDGRIAHSGSTVLALDLDPLNNQGLELLLGDITYDNMIMLFNGGSNESAFMIEEDSNFPSDNTPINLTRFPGAFHLDVDNDNLKDLIISPNGVNVSENHKNSIFYKNTGTSSITNSIQFEFIENDFLIKEMIDVGTNATPLLYDLNEDGLLDLIISNKGYFENGNYNSSITIYQNTGTESNPIFQFLTEDFSNLSSLLGLSPSIQSLHPTFGDLNNDGYVDMIIGDNNGELYYFENDGFDEDGTPSPEWPFFSEYIMLDIDVGSFATPQLIDLNRDELIDLIIGERMGIDNGVYNGINYYQNTGSTTNPIFENYTPEFFSGDFDENGEEIITKSLGGVHLADPIYLTGYTMPYIFEHEDKYHLAIGTESGLIYLYDNIENTTNNNTVLNLETEYDLVTNNMVNTNNCVHSKITIADINNDEQPDLIRGNASGGVELFLAESFNINNSLNIIQDLKIIPNPNNGKFIIEKDDDLKYDLTIYSTLGVIVMRAEIIDKRTLITIKNAKNGTYVAEIRNNKNTILRNKIIVH